jgi:glycosyltransferase involved in cell wall biosynthesis
MAATLLTVLVPVYNEEEFVVTLLERVLAAPLPDGMEREIIVVDDGSTDNSAELVETLAAAHPQILLIRHSQNRGKGASIRTAIDSAVGDISIIQDSDLEYDPREYLQLIQPILADRADVVFGSRFMAAGERRVLYYWHAVANRLLTTLCNIVSDLNLTDIETCYKAFRTSLLKSIPIRSDRFGIEPELTIKVARRQVRVYEVPISYHGRTYEEGKKIGFKDGLQALWVILRYSFTRDIYKDSGPEILDSLAGAPRFNRWMADTIAPYVGRSVLEIGAGIGNLTRMLAPRRALYFATDLDAEHLARLKGRFQHRPNVRVAHCDVAQPADFRSLAGQVDTVVCLNVIEHIEDDRGALRNIHSALVAGGRAIILVPHDQRIYGTLDTALGHYRRYATDELHARMVEAGFHVERIIEFNRISRPAWHISGRLLKRKTLGYWQLRGFDHFVWLWRRVDSSLPWRPTSLIAIGVKA